MFLALIFKVSSSLNPSCILEKKTVLVQILNQVIIFNFSSYRTPWTVGEKRFVEKTLWLLSLPCDSADY